MKRLFAIACSVLMLFGCSQSSPSADSAPEAVKVDSSAENKASTLVERNVQLAERLDNDSLHKAQILKRTFTKTWELMKTKTSLAQRYKNLRVSIDKNSNGVLLAELDPKDPTFIPTARNLNELCFYFPSDGKK